jgi:carbonic anhydrase/acetyltransferase-like protein (isoleucine patch superfamily)
MIRSLDNDTPQIHPTAYINEAAYIVGKVVIGENCSVWPGAVIRGDSGKIVIGKNTSVQDHCVIHTSNGIEIGDNVTIGHSAVVHGKKVGNNCLIGIGAIILDDAEIGDECYIAAGSLITPKTVIPARSLVMGSPAKVKSNLTPDKLEDLQHGANIYVTRAKQYKQMNY